MNEKNRNDTKTIWRVNGHVKCFEGKEIDVNIMNAVAAAAATAV